MRARPSRTGTPPSPAVWASMRQCAAAAAGREAAPAPRAPASSHAWARRARAPPSHRAGKWRRCRAAEQDDGAEWQQAAVGSGSNAARQSALALLPDEALQASAELQELCRLQLQLLTAALKLSLQAVLSSSVLGSVGDSLDEELLRQQLLLETSCLRASAYCRAPASLQTGALQLQLVATSDDGGSSGGSSGSGSVSSAQAAQRFLFLGQEGTGGGSLHEQEQWILEQAVIVLPDSGGLVLPLAHNGFLVGLLVVERCLEEGEPLAAASNGAAAAAAADTSAAAASSGISSSSSSSNGGTDALDATGAAAPEGGASRDGSAAAMPQPPACLLFRSAEVQLLKQTASVLALACAMDMRAALERVGAAVRQRQASALVQAAKKPLSMMRTLGTMLLPRLQPGEPDRDFAQGILEQGSRLSEVVSQLQAALHPAASSGVVPPALQGGGSPPSSSWQQQALPSSITSGGSSIASSSSSSQQVGLPVPARPALPSSSIGSDYQWGTSSSGDATIDMSIDELSQVQLSIHQPAAGGSGSGSTLNGSGGSRPAPPRRNAVPFGGSTGGSRASADLLNVLMPLLASASNLAAISGVAFVMTEHGSGSSSSSSSSGGSGGGGSGAAGPAVALPAAEVAVGPGTLKRMLSQLIDGIIACAARGDVVQASVHSRQWQGQPGVAITLCCCYGLNHSSGSGAAAAAPSLPRPPLQPEFAFLQNTAAEAGGMFDVHADATPDVAHLNSSALAATLWLPTVTAPGAKWS